MKSIAILTHIRYILTLLLLRFEIHRVVGQAPVGPGLLEYGAPCTKNSECDPYSPLLAFQVQCDKRSVLDDKGICGCTGDIYNIPPPPGTPPSSRPIFGYVEQFNFFDPEKGCRRTSWILAACNAGLNSCENLGIPLIRGEPPVVCRNIFDSAGFIEFKCVGRERQTRTFRSCDDEGDKRLCAELPDSVCQMQPAVQDFEACLPRIPSGSPPVLVDPPTTSTTPADFICHHDTDCRDPNARCVPSFTETVFPFSGPVEYVRGLCVCDGREGFLYTIISGKEKCIVAPTYGERCNSDTDCAVLGGNDVQCNPLVLGTSPATTYSTCQCVFPTEYFEGPRPDEAICLDVSEFMDECVNGITLSRDNLPVHNCRKRNDRHEITGLICPEGAPDPRCACPVSSEWNAGQARCVRRYVNLDEVCGTGPGLLPCNPEGYLVCVQAERTTRRCDCNDNAYRDPDGFAYCRLQQTVVGYGQVCDEISLLCSDQLNLICRYGRCRCLQDEFIVDTFAECQDIGGRNLIKTSSAGLGYEHFTLAYYLYFLAILHVLSTCGVVCPI